MNSFPSVTGSKSSVLAFFAGHLSRALLPTFVSLLTAIPAYGSYLYFSNQLELLAAEMESAGADLVNRLIIHLQRYPAQAARQSLPLIVGPTSEATPSLQFLLPRIWRHGILELIWPTLNSPEDAATSLQRGSARN